ncbi:MAG: hypothetical protein HC938_10440, partial [Nitrospira sp.]|nr:hypothetical protein [Nitrospira sp.]
MHDPHGSLSTLRGCATILHRMSAPTESSPFTPLQEWLDRIARPIEFASRDGCAHLKAVTNLSAFVSAQVLSALQQATYPKAIEARLLSLRDLFVDFEPTLSVEEQRRRLQAAVVHINALRAAAQQQPLHLQRAPVPSLRDSDVETVGRPPLWNLLVRFVKGVGPKRTTILQRLRIETVEDALWTMPWRYEDRSVMTPIGNLVPGMVASICGTIGKSEVKQAKNRRLSVLELGVEDQSGRMQ